MNKLLLELFDKTVRPFVELAAAPRAIWYVIGAFVLDSFAYFGILTLMTTYLGHDLGWGDEYAGVTVSLFTMLVTLAMLGVGSVAESFGLRRAILGGLTIAVAARAVYCLAPFALGYSAVLVILGLIMVAASSGIIQPVCYSGVKQFTDEKTSSMGYAVIYAFMNLGIVAVGALSAWVRPGVQELIDHPKSVDPTFGFFTWLRGISISGVQAVNWLCCGVSLLALVLTFLLLTRKAEATRLRPEADKPAGDPTAPWHERLAAYFTEGPFSNARFLFFIFMLLPVQTLFAHQWLTLPQYVLRAYPKEVGDKMEWLVNWINPGIIFIGVPLFTAFTRRVNVYTMMVVGTLVSAAPTFLLCGGPNLGMLITYLVHGIRQRVGPARPRGAIYGPGANPMAAGQGDDGFLFGLSAGDVLPREGSRRGPAYRPTMADLRHHRHDLADWFVACPRLGNERLAQGWRQKNRRPGKRRRGINSTQAGFPGINWAVELEPKSKNAYCPHPRPPSPRAGEGRLFSPQSQNPLIPNP
jgi:MFS family permease